MSLSIFGVVITVIIGSANDALVLVPFHLLLFLGLASHHEHYLALWLSLGEMRHELPNRSMHSLGMHLRDLARHSWNDTPFP